MHIKIRMEVICIDCEIARTATRVTVARVTIDTHRIQRKSLQQCYYNIAVALQCCCNIARTVCAV